ncbi:MAG: VWA domain-containing protein [Myxococcota bacterium]
MALLAPAMLGLLGLLVPLVVLYVLKVRRRRRRVGSTWLWAEARRDLMARAPFRRLVPQVPLLVQALILIGLAVAAARPATRGRGLDGDHVAIVVDTSASMSAIDPETGVPRIELARRAAHEVIDGLAPGSDAILLDAGRNPRVALSPDRDVRRMHAAVDRLRPREVEGDLGAAIALAVGRMTQLGGTSRVLVLTDGHLARPIPTHNVAVPLDVMVVSSGPVDNVGIVRVDVRLGRDPGLDRDVVQAFLSVANYGPAPREIFVTMRQQNASDTLASRNVVVPAGEKLPVVLSFPPAEGDYGSGLVFEVSPGDAFAVDDRACGRVPARPRQPGYVASAGPAPSPWLLRALVSDPRAEVREGTVAELLARAPAIPADAFVVVEGACPQKAPGADLLIVDPPGGDCLGAVVGPEIVSPSITSWASADARLRFLTLEGVFLERARRIEPLSRSQELIRTDRGVVAADVSTSSRRATLLGFDVGDSNWPLRASFVLFVRNLVEQARQGRSKGGRGPSTVGTPLRLSVPAAVSAVDVRAPGSEDAVSYPARDGLVVVPEVDRTGLYRVSWEGPAGGSRWVAVNLTSPDESDLSRRLPAAEKGPVTIGTGPGVAAAYRDWGWILALVALGLIAFDVWWLTRPARRGRPAAARRRRWLRPTLGVGLGLAALPAIYVALVWLRLIPESYVRLARPLAAGLALPVMAFAAFRLATAAAAAGPRRLSLRHALGDLTLGVAILASALAAAGPEWGRPLDRLAVLAVVDRSRSIDLVPSAPTRVARELAVATEGMRDDDRIGTIVFGADAAVEEPLRRPADLPTPQRVDVGRDGTDIAAGLERALAEMPADAAGRIVLLSDGVATRGDAMAAAAAAVASDIPIDVLVLEQRPVADIRIVSAQTTTPVASEGETLGMRVVIASPAATEVELRLIRDGTLVRRIQAQVAAGEDVLRFAEPAPTAGLHRYDVEVTAADPSLDESAEDNRASLFVKVRGPARALVLDGDEGATGFVAHALRAADFRVDEGRVSAFPADVGAMAAYDLIVFGDIAAADVRPAQHDALATYVRDLGGGVLLVGGDRSFGPGGWSKTPIEEISPVAFDLKQERHRASLAQVIAIDISGSMGMRVGRQTKLELANEAAVRSAALLGGGDRLGVLHVDTQPNWAVNLAPVDDHKRIETAIRSVGPGGGGIYVDVALREAYGALRAQAVNLKHVLVFADGGDAENIDAGVQAAVDAAFAGGITTSCVALGRGSDSGALEDLSRRGGGRFYIVEDASRLPAVFAQETVLASRSALNEVPFRAVPADPHPVREGVDLEAAPNLEGYVVTVAKPRADVTMLGPDGDPLLALWRVGLGRAGAFTSDLKDRWGGAWTQWEGAARLLVQTARHLARREENGRVRLEAETAAGMLHLRATVLDGEGRLSSFRRLRAAVRGPDGFERNVALEAASAGTYVAALPLQQPGAYIAVAQDEDSEALLATTGAALTAGEELRPTGSDVALLNRLRELSGGTRRDTMAGIFAERADLRFGYRDVTLPLLWVAAFAMLLAVAARRLAFPPRRRRKKSPVSAAPSDARASSALASATPAGATLGALVRRRRTASPTPPPKPQPPPPPPAEGPSPTGGPVGPPPPWRNHDPPGGAAQPPPPGPPATPTTSSSGPGPATPTPQPPAAPRTAAELLLERKRRKRR